MKVKKGNVEALAEVENISGCSNFGCMAIRGQEAWGLKTNTAQTLSVLYHCKDVNIAVTSHYEIANLLGHGNGMAYDGRYLYLASGIVGASPQEQNRYLLRVPRGFRGDLRDSVKIATPGAVLSVSYYRKNHMIVSVKSDVEGYRRFAIGRISVDEKAKRGMMRYVSFIYVKIDITGFMKQDIYYDPQKKLLFLPHNKKDSEGRILFNRIFVVNMAGPGKRINGSRAFTPSMVIAIDKSLQEGYTKFEVESLGLDSNRRIVLAANVLGKMDDHFYRVTNMKF